MNLIGRKGTLIFGIIPGVIGWVLILAAPNILTMIFGRVFLGVCLGTNSIVGSVYIGEIVEKHIRGTVGAFIQVNLCLGVLFVFSIYALNVFWISLVCLIVTVIIGIGLLLIPESPAYYVRKQNRSGAYRSLKWLRGSKIDISTELEALQAEERENLLKNKNNSLRKSLRRRECMRALIIVVGLSIFQQACGINVVKFNFF